MKDNTKMLRERKKAFLEGKHIGRLPFGYGKKEGEIVVITSHKSSVLLIFRYREIGLGYRAIARKMDLFNYDNTPKHIYVKNIIENPFYAGYVRFDDKIKQGIHPKIIDPERFLKINDKKSFEEFV